LANVGSGAAVAAKWFPQTVIVAPRQKTTVGSAAVLPSHFRASNIENDVPVVGVPNPYGVGASAYEPETELYDPGVDNPLLKGWDDAYNAVQRSRAKERAAQAGTTEIPADTVIGSDAHGPMVKGSAAAVIAAAKTMLGKPYIWGGTTSRGVDCSGLLYLAFNQAGIPMRRFVASEYGKMGQQVSAHDARPGDVVYWDEKGPVDHVGIYLGNGMVIQSPQSGDVTKISRVWGNPTYRRILNDSAFGKQATPSGQPVVSYRGQVATGAAAAAIGVASPVHLSGGS